MSKEQAQPEKEPAAVSASLAAALDDYVTRAELASALQARGFRITTATLARWATTDDGPKGFRLGANFVYGVGALREWLRQRDPTTRTGARQ